MKKKLSNIERIRLINQAGVSFDYVVDTWDFNTVAGYYAQSKKGDNFSMTYGASELDGTEDTGEAAVSGRLTVGLPIFYAVAQRNSSLSMINDTLKSEATQNDSTTTVQLGTVFGNLGVALFADMNDDSLTTKKHDGSLIDTDLDGINDALDPNKESTSELTYTQTQNKFGINLGQSTEGLASAWTHWVLPIPW